MTSYRAEQRGPELLTHLVLCEVRWCLAGFGEFVGEAEKLPDKLLTLSIDPECCAGSQRTYPTVEGIWLGHMAPQEESNVTGRFRIGVDLLAFEQGFHLRRHAKGHAIIGIVERLDSVWVASKQQAFLFRIIYREGVHATEMFDQVSSVFLIQME